MGAGASLLSEAELHGLVDDRLDDGRRSELLRRLAASPLDRALVAAWKEQGDLIREAFSDVERESVPRALDLTSPQLRCVGSGEEPHMTAPRRDPIGRRGRYRGLAIAPLVVVTSLFGAWLMIAPIGRSDGGEEPVVPQTTLDASVADRTVAAVDDTAFGPQTSSGVASGSGLPSIRIPDLSSAGFMLFNVSTEAGEPGKLILHYRNADEDRLAIGVSRLPSEATPSEPTASGRSFVWHRRNAAFAIAGTVPADKLRTIAISLQNDAAD